MLGRSIDTLFRGLRLYPRTLEEVEAPEPLGTAWEPEGITDADLEDVEITPETLDGSQVRALMLEVLRRAIHDWVLYRSSRRMEHRELAHDAYVWLFEEGPEHPWWAERQKSGKSLMSLVSICAVIDIDIERIREEARAMTEKKIKTAGRPPERRRRYTEDSSYYAEHVVNATYECPPEEE